MYNYYTVTTDIFRQLILPSSGWQEQAYINPEDGHVSDRNMSVVTMK